MINHKTKKGFTLFELLILLVVFGAIAGGGAKLLTTALDSHAASHDMDTVVREATATYARISRELRLIKAGTGNLKLSHRGIAFIDINGDTITYSINGTQLLRNGVVLAKNVTDLSFSGYDKDGALDVKVLELAPSVDTTTEVVRNIHFLVTFLLSNATTMTLESMISPKNIK